MSRALAGARTSAVNRSVAGERIADLGITKALHLYGAVNSNVDVGYQTFLDGTPFTVCVRFWATKSAMSDDGSLFAYGYDSATDKGYAIRANGSTRRLQVFWGTGTNVATANNVMIVNKKYYFIDFDGVNAGRVYEGTDLKHSFTMAPRVAHATNHTYFGTRDNVGRHATGVLGDCAVYARRLTDDERRAIVQRASYPSGAQVQYKMDDESSTIVDYSGNGRNGTVTTGLWRNSPFNG